jgi:hypothetical protein
MISSCKYSTELNELTKIEKTKNEIVSLGDFELTNDNQIILKNYFELIKEISYKFQSDERMQRYFHKRFNRYFKAQYCSSSLLEKDLYDRIIKKCTVDNFFVCSDDLRHFSGILKKMMGELTTQETAQLIVDEKCKSILINYGLIDN